MAFVPFIDVAMVEVLYELYGQRCENTLYFNALTAPDVSYMESLGDAINDWARINIMPYLVQDCILLGTKVTDLNTSSSPSIERLLTLPEAGGETGTGMSNNACWCIQFKTLGRGRTNRGRNYIMGLSTNALVTPNQVSTTFAGHIVDAYNLLLGSTSLPSDWGWCIASRYLNGAQRTVGQTAPVLSVGYADRFVDSQRRRLVGRGT